MSMPYSIHKRLKRLSLEMGNDTAHVNLWEVVGKLLDESHEKKGINKGDPDYYEL